MVDFPKLEQPSVFIAAPGDLEGLRDATRGILADLKNRAADDYGIEVYDWGIDLEDFEHSKSAQEQIPLPSDPLCRAVVCMFGERIGTPLFQNYALEDLGAVLGQHAAPDPGWKYRLIHPWPESGSAQVLEEGGFALTGTVLSAWRRSMRTRRRAYRVASEVVKGPTRPCASSLSVKTAYADLSTLKRPDGDTSACMMRSLMRLKTRLLAESVESELIHGCLRSTGRSCCS